MKKKFKDDLEIFVDPKPLTKEEAEALAKFIQQMKSKAKTKPKLKKPVRGSGLKLGLKA